MFDAMQQSHVPVLLAPIPALARSTAVAVLAGLAVTGAADAWAQAAPAAPPADNCEGIRLQIEGRFRGGGVANPGLLVVPAGSSGTGRVVGTCGSGSRQIVYTGPGAASQTGAAAPAAAGSPRVAVDRQAAATATPSAVAQPVADKIPTECKDGSIVIGPRCDDPRAVRMTSAEIASLTAVAASAAPASATPASAALPARVASASPAASQ